MNKRTSTLITCTLTLAGVCFSQNPIPADPAAQPAPPAKLTWKQKFGRRVQTALILSAMQQEQLRRQQEQQRALDRNHNGGRAKYAMDGVSVGDGYYIDRSGSSATKY